MGLSGKSSVLSALASAAVLLGTVVGAAPADAATVTSVQSTWGTNGRVSVIVTDPATGKVYVGGNFTAVTDSAGNVQAPVTNLAEFDPIAGKFDTSWQFNPNGRVAALAVSNGRLFVGGDFTQIGGQSRARLASIDLTSASVQSWNPRASGGTVRALTVNGGWGYVGGNFTGLGGAPISFLGRVDANTGSVDTGWVPRPDDHVQSLIAPPTGGKVYAGGDFTTVLGDTRAHSIASINTTTPATLTSGFTAGATNQGSKPPAFSLYLDGSYLVAGVAGSGGACAALNAGTGKTLWSDHANGNMQAVTVISGTVYCGGHFGGLASFAGQDRYKLAAVNETTGAVQPFAPRINTPLGVWALNHDSTRLYVGGDFTKINRQIQYHFAVFT